MARYSAMSGGQGDMRLLLLADRGIQRAEAAMAMRLEGTHAACLGQGEGVLVVRVGLTNTGKVVVHGDLAQEPQRLGLAAVSLAGTTIGQRLLGEVTGFSSMAKQEIGPAKSRQVDDPRVPCARLLQQREGCCDTLRQGVGTP